MSMIVLKFSPTKCAGFVNKTTDKTFSNEQNHFFLQMQINHQIDVFFRTFTLSTLLKGYIFSNMFSFSKTVSDFSIKILNYKNLIHLKHPKVSRYRTRGASEIHCTRATKHASFETHSRSHQKYKIGVPLVHKRTFILPKVLWEKKFATVNLLFHFCWHTLYQISRLVTAARVKYTRFMTTVSTKF